MSSVKRKITKIVAVVIGIFAVLNLFWFGWRQIRYSAFADGMEQTELSTLLAPRYVAKDRDGFDYSVKWLKIFGGYEYGVILKDPNDPSNEWVYVLYHP